MRTKFRLLFLPLRWEFGCQQICMTLSRERETRARRTLELWDSSSTARKASLKIGKVRRRAHAALKVRGRCGTFFTFLENFKMTFWSHYFTAATHFDAFSERRDSHLSFRKKLKRGKIETSRPVSANALFSLFLFSAKLHNELEVVSSVVFTLACVRSGECPFFLSFERKKPKVPKLAQDLLAGARRSFFRRKENVGVR